MNSSASITKISEALVKAQSEMGNAVKDALNPFFKKSYADLNSVREACLPILNKHGISALQPTCFIDGVPFVETVLLHTSGEYISSLTMIVVDKVNDAQRHGSGLSYARRYALSSIVNIGAEDDDANKAAGKIQQPNEQPATPTAAAVVAPVVTPEKIVTAKRPTTKEITEANKLLMACKTFADLASTWTAFSKDLQAATVSKKDELKAKLKPAQPA